MRYLALIALLPALVLGQGPDKGKITIGDVKHSGSGFPQGSVSTTFDPDRTVSSPTLHFIIWRPFRPTGSRSCESPSHDARN